ncbi:MAG: acyl-CoA dehydrogenase family protein [Actinobacteria bacterium]|nr:acyl-CoA dehydrogenase family protein [Actinomycetota bacterium]
MIIAADQPESWEQTARAFTAAVEDGRLVLPLPGHGRTRVRWAALAGLAESDLSLARLAEGHADALAILDELGGPTPPAGSRWGVWAAMPPGPSLAASFSDGTWWLDGTKQYCSGARVCTHVLVTAQTPDGVRLFVAETGADGVRPVPGTWPAVGMAGSDTLDVRFSRVAAEPVGPPGGYVNRPGFAHGGVGVAACWYGGARGVARLLLATARQRDLGPHGFAHLGAVDIALRTASAALDQAADDIDDDPLDRKEAGPRRALRVRTLTESVATEVLERVGRALGAGPLGHDAEHAQRVADLTVYLRQHHAERDQEQLGRLVAKEGTTW